MVNKEIWKYPDVVHGVFTKWHWVVYYPEYFKLGRYTDIGIFTYINAFGIVEIDDNVEIGSHCSIYSVSTIDNKKGKVVIGKDTKIGTHSTVMPNVTIGKNCIIGAYSFVNKDIPDNSVAYGIPCKVVKENEKQM